MTNARLVELVGLFLLVVGAGAVVAAAAMVSVALAVLAVGVFTLFGGLVCVYVANLALPAAGRQP